jgi:ribonuclease Y
VNDTILIAEIGLLALGGLLGVGVYLSARSALRRQAEATRRESETLLDAARTRAAAQSEEILAEARAAAEGRRVAAEEESGRRLAEASRVESLALGHEAAAARIETEVELSLEEARRRNAEAAAAASAAAADREAAAAALEDQRAELERIAGLTAAAAREELLQRVQQEASADAARLVDRIASQARQEAAETARRSVVQALWRLSPREVLDPLASQVRLPDDDMKGRIIGREGRNIRTLELATGVDVIIDNTPGVILLSSYDPVRREVARLSLERLIEDGRIHPARIESVVEKVRAELEGAVQGIGETAAFEVGLTDVHPKLLRSVGLLRFRTLRGYNLLAQSTETALIAGHMAAEIGVREMVARRAGLLHAIAWADEELHSGPGAAVSAEIAAKYGESPEVVHAIAALVPGVEPQTAEAVLVGLARRISESRPGARKDNVAVYIDRMKRLEELALSCPGVKLAYAIRGGKEMRILVESATLTDEQAVLLSRELARRIEKEVNLPGELKVIVIRETRSVDYAV